MEQEGKKDGWDKLRAAAPAIAALAVPLAVAYIGGAFANAAKDSENRLKYVELAVGVLTSKPSDETLALREWAISLLDKSAPVPLPQAAKDQLLKQALPHATVQGAVTLDDVRVSGGFVGSTPAPAGPQAAPRAAQASKAAPPAAVAPAPAAVAAPAASVPLGGAVVGGVIGLDGPSTPSSANKRAP